jgi:predicted component of viral defense system (DUF524 family)
MTIAAETDAGTGTLILRRKGDSAAVQPLSDGHFLLQAEGAWILEGTADRVRQAHGSLADVSVSVTATALEVTFGNAVGHFDVPGLGQVEVVSGKWDRRHFDAMLADLMDVASALPFDAGAAAALPYDRSVAAREDVLYHAFVYLRRVLSDDVALEDRLVPAVEQVMRDPHRRFERHREQVPLELAHRIEPSGMERLATGQAELVSVRGRPAATLPLAIALRGHLPLTVEQVRVDPTCDTPENRFVKAFLDQALAIAARVRELVDRHEGQPGVFAERIRQDCTRIERRLRPLRHHALWESVGTMTHLPAGSTVLQRRCGYREVYRHFARLRLAARVPLAPEVVWDLLEARDIAELYELWCYFALVRALCELLGQPVEAGGTEEHDWGLAVRWGLATRWADGTRLEYNPRFSRSKPADRHSYSVPLRPDIALEVPEGPDAGLHLLDAKFKLDQLQDLLANEDIYDDVAEAAEERRGTFKRGDLYKMHAYRDAIPRARSVWILYPGSEAHFYAVTGEHIAGGPAFALLGALRGVGAIPLVPFEDEVANTAIRGLLRRLLCR